MSYFSNFSLGDKQIHALSFMSGNVSAFKKYKFRNNRITSLGADQLLTRINKNMISLDLSANKIGEKGANHLHEILCKPWCKL
jgi:hypothetical protein